MTLNSQYNYPSTRSYVLKLHRSAEPRRERITGRLESITSGRQFDFKTADELFACLAADLESAAAQPKE